MRKKGFEDFRNSSTIPSKCALTIRSGKTLDSSGKSCMVTEHTNILLMSVIGGHLKYWKWGSFMIVCNQPTYWKTSPLTKELSIRCPPWSFCAHIKVSPPTRIDVGDWRITKIKLETYLEGVCVTWGSVYFGEMMVFKLSRRPLTAWSEGTFSKVIPECQPSLARVFVRRPGLAIPLHVVLKPTSFPETDHGIPLRGNDRDFTTQLWDIFRNRVPM